MLDPGPERRTSTLAGLMEPLQRAPHLNLALVYRLAPIILHRLSSLTKLNLNNNEIKKVIKQKA